MIVEQHGIVSVTLFLKMFKPILQSEVCRFYAGNVLVKRAFQSPKQDVLVVHPRGWRSPAHKEI
jgi:hypothetical protein